MSLQVIGKGPVLPKQLQPSVLKDDAKKTSRPIAGSNYDLRTLRHAYLVDDQLFSTYGWPS
jgi:hypothetical protein